MATAKTEAEAAAAKAAAIELQLTAAQAEATTAAIAAEKATRALFDRVHEVKRMQRNDRRRLNKKRRPSSRSGEPSAVEVVTVTESEDEDQAGIGAMAAQTMPLHLPPSPKELFVAHAKGTGAAGEGGNDDDETRKLEELWPLLDSNDQVPCFRLYPLRLFFFARAQAVGAGGWSVSQRSHRFRVRCTVAVRTGGTGSESHLQKKEGGRARVASPGELACGRWRRVVDEPAKSIAARGRSYAEVRAHTT